MIEAAIEDLDAKRAIFRALDRTRAAAGHPRHEHQRAVGRGRSPRLTDRPSRVIGLHFFNPAPVMRARRGRRRAGDGPGAGRRGPSG